MQLLLDERIILTPADNKTNRGIALTVPRSYHALFIRTRYEPKQITDTELSRSLIEAGIQRYIPESARQTNGNWQDFLPLYNLVTLSLDYEDEYLGCAHRQSPVMDHIISADYASLGFRRHPASAGIWKLVLNCHAVISEKVTYLLQVYGADKGEELHDHIQAL